MWSLPCVFSHVKLNYNLEVMHFIKFKRFNLQSKINLPTCMKNYTTFPEQNCADSQ